MIVQTHLKYPSTRIHPKFWLLLIPFLWWSCEQSDPQLSGVNTEVFGRVGDSLRFSGLDWTVKIHEDNQWGPGPNFFSGNENDVYLDENGYLHLKIVQRDERWYSTEVVADEYTGFGTYRWTIEGYPDAFPSNIVLGLFTWDNNTFSQQANSEVDIEFSKWGNANQARTLQYGVQPINFGTYFPERDYKPDYEAGTIDGVSTHEFIWTDTLITWNSYRGDQATPGQLFGSWTFDTDNPARVKNEGGRASNPIVIPEPGVTTSARMNLWILTGVSVGPVDLAPHEIIIRKFEYLPL